MTVQHSVAIWANWSQILLGINRVGSSNRGEIFQVVNVNESSSNATVGSLEVEAAHYALHAMMFDALAPSAEVAFKRVHRHPSQQTFREKVGVLNFFWQQFASFWIGKRVQSSDDFRLRYLAHAEAEMVLFFDEQLKPCIRHQVDWRIESASASDYAMLFFAIARLHLVDDPSRLQKITHSL